MSRQFEIKFEGLTELQSAIKRNPQKVLSEIKKFIQRGIAEYKRGIINNPWKVGMTGGGSPVLTGNLRDTHLTKFTNLTGMIRPATKDNEPAPYGKYVHKKRPWMDYVFKDKMPNIEKLEDELLKNVITDLAN
jgi:hypothetical protein